MVDLGWISIKYSVFVAVLLCIILVCLRFWYGFKRLSVPVVVHLYCTVSCLVSIYIYIHIWLIGMYAFLFVTLLVLLCVSESAFGRGYDCSISVTVMLCILFNIFTMCR